jgi:hypothetical protein
LKKILFILLVFSILACEPEKLQDQFGDVIVQIDNKKLYASEIENIIHDETSTQDSTAIANAYIDRWIKDQLMIRDAQKYLSSDFEIEELVEDYRNELIKFKYEEEIINQNMNLKVNESDLQSYYNKYKSNYLLSAPIYKIIYASIPAKTEKIDRFYNAWLNNEFDFIESFGSQYADTMYLNRNEWIDRQKMNEIVPEELIKGQNLRRERTIQKNINNYEYFFKILEMKTASDTIPLVLLKDKIERLVIHERKKETIENYKQEIFDKSMRSKIIKIDIQ